MYQIYSKSGSETTQGNQLPVGLEIGMGVKTHVYPKNFFSRETTSRRVIHLIGQFQKTASSRLMITELHITQGRVISGWIKTVL